MFYQKKNNVLEPLTGSTLYAETPIGTVIASFLAVAPSGYIKADGTVYTKAQYPELYERIPDVFKDTTNETFTIDLREVALKGIGLSSLTTEHYSSTGLTLGQFIDDRLQDHEHNITRGSGVYLNTVNTSVSTSGDIQIGRYTTAALAKASDISSGRHGTTTEVKSVGVNYFIKAKHVALPIDIMDAISEEYATKEELSYFTNEIDTGKKWIDGKSIYRQVFSGTYSNDSVLINGNVENVISVSGRLSLANGSQLPLPWGSSAGYCSVMRSSSGNSVTVYTSYSNLYMRIVVEYTKVTE